ncbi:MAG: hypothetical protein PHW72_02865 [Candidatus Pacebacteria bacterium]|nr:hypothetical protein [Candidatus Paceibacterota bacterium]
MKKNKTKAGILGYGEVGQAISKFYKNPRIKDLKRDDGVEGSEILHVCIPWSEKFIKTVVSEIKKIKPQLTIIHSTVAPGTTKKIISILPEEFKKVVHSPIRGMHPDLYPGIKIFLKYIGAENKVSGKLAENHLKSLGIRVKTFQPAAASELGKLLDTTYYALCIAWHGEMGKFCRKYGVDFNDAVTDFNSTYNEGYKKLGKPNVIRPVLSPPQNGITGHCLIPNVKVLRKIFKSKALDLILQYDPNR